MIEQSRVMLGKTLWSIADELRGIMNADDFRDYMLSFLILRYLSDNYESAAKGKLGRNYPKFHNDDRHIPLITWYSKNPDQVQDFERCMRYELNYVIIPRHLWGNIVGLARSHSNELLEVLQSSLESIEAESFEGKLRGLFAAVDLSSDKLGRTYSDRNAKLCTIIHKIADGLAEFSTETNDLGDVSEYLIGQFAAGSGKRGGEFYTPQQISDVLASIVTLDIHSPKVGPKNRLRSVMDFACGSGSLLLNVRKRMRSSEIGKMYGQEYNLTTYNLARMNMLLHGVKYTEFEIHHGDTLINDWSTLHDSGGGERPTFDAIVSNPPLSRSWAPSETLVDDVRFMNYGLAPKSTADFAFLLHGLHFLKDDGIMAIVLSHGVLFRGGVEQRIRTKLLSEGHIDAIIGLPSNLLYSTGIPVCIVVLKKRKSPGDVLFINAAEHFVKGKRQNNITAEHITKITSTYQFRKEERRYSRLVTMDEIKSNEYSLAIARYIDTANTEKDIDFEALNNEMVSLESEIQKMRDKHNMLLKDLGLPELV